MHGHYYQPLAIVHKYVLDTLGVGPSVRYEGQDTASLRSKLAADVIDTLPSLQKVMSADELRHT